MKKFLLLATLMIMSVATFAQDSTQASNIPDTAKVTFTKVYKDVKQAIAGLADGLKVGAEKVFIILVKQQVVVAITNSIMYLLLIICTWAFVSKFKSNYKRVKTKDDDWYNDSLDDHAGLVIPLIGSIVSLLLCFIVMVSTMTDTITGFINPEYGAIEKVMEMIK